MLRPAFGLDGRERGGFKQLFVMFNGAWKSKASKAPLQTLYPGDKARRKQQLIAKGQKFFAYGYGPIQSKDLVIEDVAKVDDDEEDYGEYQATRIDANSTNTSIWDSGWGKCEENSDELWNDFELEGQTVFDEYANARKTKFNRRNPKVTPVVMG